MNELIYNTVGIRFKPEDSSVGIPMNMLEIIEKKTKAELLDDNEMENILRENNLDRKDILGIQKVLHNRMREKNGCLIEYSFLYSNGWYRLEKYNCDRIQQEIDFLTEFVQKTCNPIKLTIQELF